MRRHPTLALVGAALALGAVLVWPSIDRDARTPVPAGAVLELTGRPSPDTVAAATEHPSAAAPVPSTAQLASAVPSPDPVFVPSVLPPEVRPEPGQARALEGERPGLAEPDAAPDPRLLTGYRWPIGQVRITNPYGPSWFGDSIVDGQRFHDGLDLATFCGDRIMAAHDGIVLAAGRRFDAFIGWIGSIEPHAALMDATHHWAALPIVVIVDDGNGYRSIYAHFNALASNVRPGQRVRAGQFLGWEGATGFASGCHLHYGLFSPYETGRLPASPRHRPQDALPGLADRPCRSAPGPSPSDGRERGEAGSEPLAEALIGSRERVSPWRPRSSVGSGGR